MNLTITKNKNSTYPKKLSQNGRNSQRNAQFINRRTFQFPPNFFSIRTHYLFIFDRDLRNVKCYWMLKHYWCLCFGSDRPLTGVASAVNKLFSCGFQTSPLKDPKIEGGTWRVHIVMTRLFIVLPWKVVPEKKRGKWTVIVEWKSCQLAEREIRVFMGCCFWWFLVKRFVEFFKNCHLN